MVSKIIVVINIIKETYEPWKGVRRNERRGRTFAFGSFNGKDSKTISTCAC